MKKALAAGLIILGVFALTGCSDDRWDRLEERYKLCIENGGSWIEDGWGESCVMPDNKNK